MSAEVAEVGRSPLAYAGDVVDLASVSLRRQLELLDPEGSIQILSGREGGLIECYVPFSLIDNEEVPVKEEHAASLASDFQEIARAEGGTGQHTAIVLGLIEGESTLKIMDGFHRSAGLKQIGIEYVFATVKLTDWDGLFDYRIFTAKDHAHVRFSRVVQWITEIWARNELASKLTVEQAFLLYQYNLPGTKLGLTPEDAEAAKAWVQHKEKRWDVAAMTIHGHLKTTENVDPQLVHSTREKRSSRILEAPTQAILKIFSKELPGNFPLQNLIMEVAKTAKLPATKGTRSLTGPEIRSLCLMVRDYPDVESADELIQEIDWSSWEPEYGESQKKALRRAYDPGQKGAAVLDVAAKQIANILDRINLSIQRNEKPTAEQITNLKAAESRVRELVGELGSLGLALSRRARAAEETLKPPISIFDQPQHTSQPPPKKSPMTQTTTAAPPQQPARSPSPASSRMSTFDAPRQPAGRSEIKSSDISQALSDFLHGKGNMPEIKTRSHIRQAEHASHETVSDPSRLEDLLERIQEAREEIRENRR